MANPTVGSWRKLKRIARYLEGRPRLVMEYKWQREEEDLDGFADSDWAGCRSTGESTSGGAIMVGSHFIKGWSRTQNSITVSSAEAEEVAMCKLTAELLGVTNILKEWGEQKRGVVYGDSSAALAVAKRKGSGKLRHINVGMLWIQEKQSREEVVSNKIAGVLTQADLMTKHLAAKGILGIATGWVWR